MRLSTTVPSRWRGRSESRRLSSSSSGRSAQLGGTVLRGMDALQSVSRRHEPRRQQKVRESEEKPFRPSRSVKVRMWPCVAVHIVEVRAVTRDTATAPNECYAAVKVVHDKRGHDETG